jgi:hypothetical protein
MIEQIIKSDIPFLLVISNEITGKDYTIIYLENRNIETLLIHPREWHLINKFISKLTLKVNNKLGQIYDYKSFKQNIEAQSRYNFVRKLN